MRARARGGRVLAGALVALAGSAAGPCDAAAQRQAESFPPELIRGREVEIRLQGEKVRGELLAVTTDSLWFLQADVTRAVALGGLPEVAVRRHGLDGRKGLIWSALGGTITGMLLTTACSSVEDAVCSGVFPVTLGSWLVVGGLASLALERSSKAELPPNRDALRPYARFPQGMPAGYPRDGGG